MKRFSVFKLFSMALVVCCLAFMACRKDHGPDVVQIPLLVQGFYPNSGKAGTLVTIHGKGFATKPGENEVKFGDIAAEVVALDSGKLVVHAPIGGNTGMVSVSNGKTKIEAGVYTYQALTIKLIDPANGPAGSHIRIFGEGFSSMTEPAKVTINGKSSILASASDTLLVAEVPDEAGSGPVEVFVDGKSVKGQNFFYQAIRTVKPLTGGAGTRVRIIGEGFDLEASKNIIDFNGVRGKLLESTSGCILVEVPEGVETGPIAVTVNGQRATGPIFSVVPLPTIKEVTPLSGPTGLVMTISGADFSSLTDENIVLIDGKAMQIVSASSSELQVKIAGNTTSGKVVVVVNDQRKEGPDFKVQNLAVMKFAPDNGQDNLEVNITGKGFSNNPTENQVTFNGVVAQVIASSDTLLVVKTPVNTATGYIRVAVDGKEAFSSREFRRTGMVTIKPWTQQMISLAVDGSGNIFTIDGNQIVKIDSKGNIAPFAGDKLIAGNTDAEGIYARFRFSYLSSLLIDDSGNLYVSEQQNGLIRKITKDGRVTTLATIPAPKKMALAPDNSLLVISNRNLHKVLQNGSVTQVQAGGYNSFVNEDYLEPAADRNGNVYYWNDDYNYGRMIARVRGDVNAYPDFKWVGGGSYTNPDGIGDKAYFGSSGGMKADKEGNLVIASSDVNSPWPPIIRYLNIATREVTTPYKFLRGYKDGALYEAAAGYISAMALAPNGDIYFYDSINQSIRKIYLR